MTDTEQQEQSEEMKPCECGGEARAFCPSSNEEYLAGSRPFVGCIKCGKATWAPVMFDAITAWNTRHPTAREKELEEAERLLEDVLPALDWAVVKDGNNPLTYEQTEYLTAAPQSIRDFLDRVKG